MPPLLLMGPGKSSEGKPGVVATGDHQQLSSEGLATATLSQAERKLERSTQTPLLPPPDLQLIPPTGRIQVGKVGVVPQVSLWSTKQGGEG